MRRIGTIWSTVFALVLGFCALALPNAARAQGDESTSEGDLSQDWTIRVGLYVLQSQSGRNINGEAGISGIVERRVYTGRGYDVDIGIGYNGLDRVYSIPVMANLIAHNANLRYGLGAGYSFNKRYDGRGSSGAVFDLIFGYQFTRGKNPLSVDLRYFFVSGSSNELDGYSVTLGLKF